MTSPYLQRPLRSLDEARRDKGTAQAMPAQDAAPLPSEIKTETQIDRSSKRLVVPGGRLVVAIIVVGLMVAGAAAWTLSGRTEKEQDALARELNDLTPAAGPSVPKPTTLIGETDQAVPDHLDQSPRPVFRP